MVAVTLDWNGLITAIRVERARRQWSQADLAEFASVSTTTIKNLEGGRDYQKPPIALLMAVDRAFEWPVGTLESVLRQSGEIPATSEPAVSVSDLPGDKPGPAAGNVQAEADLESRYRREPAGPTDNADMIHNIVYKVVRTVAPGTSLAEFQKLEAEALGIAARYGIVPARRDDQASDGIDRENFEL